MGFEIAYGRLPQDILEREVKMKYVCLIAVLSLCGCGAEGRHYVQGGSASLDEVMAQSIAECGGFADKVFVDQCFEFDCKTKKFVLWDENCSEKEAAEKLMKENAAYFEKWEP